MSSDLPNASNYPPKLFELLSALEEHGIWHVLRSTQEGAIGVTFLVPGCFWELDFFEDGEVLVERFTSDGVDVGIDAAFEAIAAAGS